MAGILLYRQVRACQRCGSAREWRQPNWRYCLGHVCGGGSLSARPSRGRICRERRTGSQRTEPSAEALLIRRRRPACADKDQSPAERLGHDLADVDGATRDSIRRSSSRDSTDSTAAAGPGCVAPRKIANDFVLHRNFERIQGHDARLDDHRIDAAGYLDAAAPPRLEPKQSRQLVIATRQSAPPRPVVLLRWPRYARSCRPGGHDRRP